MRVKFTFLLLIPVILYMFFQLSSFLSSKTLSGKELYFDNGFYLLDKDYGGDKISEFMLLTCVHCINTLPKSILFFNKNKMESTRIHPYYNEKQKELSVFFYLLKMDTDDKTLEEFISYMGGLGHKTAKDITTEELYHFYKNHKKETQPTLSINEFKLIINGNKKSPALDKANLAKIKADEIDLKATPAILIGNKITSFSIFKKDTDMLEALKNEYVNKN